MKIPHTINANVFKEYEPSKEALELVPEARRKIKSEDRTWDKNHPPRLTELCVLVIVANFKNRIILQELPCWDRNSLLEILPTDLPLPLVLRYVQDQIYWKRRVKARWTESANYVQDYGFDWRRMFMERHVQEAVEAMTPEGFDLDTIARLCNLTKDYVKNLDLRQLQILRSPVSVEEEDEFTVLPEPCDHIDLAPVIIGLVNLTELHVQFGLRDVGSDYKKAWFQFSLQDCRNLGAGVANSTSLKLLRVHSCNLDDDRLIALLSSMVDNESLEEINFSNCIIQDDGATAVARFMKNREKLKRVNLSNNKIKENGVAALAFMITQSYSSPLEYLNLKFNAFGDEGIKFLASALVRERSAIRELNVSCCDLGENSGILIAEMLNRNSIITHLNLSNNHLGKTAGRALEAAVQNNQTIQKLDLRMTKISDEDMVKIKDVLVFNRIRALKGEKGIERELRLRAKRAEEERLRKIREEQEAIELAKAEAAKLAELKAAAAAAAEAEAAEQEPSTVD